MRIHTSVPSFVLGSRALRSLVCHLLLEYTWCRVTGAHLSFLDPVVKLQRQYYTETASRYDVMHRHEGIDDPECRKIIVSILRSLQIQSLLDVGSGTGRGLQDFAAGIPGAFVCGVEPVGALVQQGVVADNARTVSLLQASGEALPFSDDSFDAVSEFSTLHHVANPSAVVREMMRVARRAVVNRRLQPIRSRSTACKAFQVVPVQGWLVECL